MQEEFIKLALNQGFRSKFLYNYPFKYSTIEYLRYYYWMRELELWINEKYDYRIQISAVEDETSISKEAFNVVVIDMKNQKYLFEYETCDELSHILETTLYRILKGEVNGK